jgi:copper chaperone CopZ
MKHCKECGHRIEVAVVEMDGHDINIMDTQHEDNSITITKDEAEVVLKALKSILKRV